MLPVTTLRLGECLAGLAARGYASGDSRVLLWTTAPPTGPGSLSARPTSATSASPGSGSTATAGIRRALTEGLMCARERRAVSVSIDADLQDDVRAIYAMAEKRAAGAHIVCGVRASRATDTFMKRNTARAYYKIMRLLGSSLIYDHADFRLMGPEALDALALYTGTTSSCAGS